MYLKKEKQKPQNLKLLPIGCHGIIKGFVTRLYFIEVNRPEIKLNIFRLIRVDTNIFYDKILEIFSLYLITNLNYFFK